jgi:hypothetical protein
MPDHGTTSRPEAVSFEAGIKPMFRASDRAAMQKAFDMWSLTDVTAHGAQIAEKLQSGAMPGEGPWPAEYVALFIDWLNSGSRP